MKPVLSKESTAGNRPLGRFGGVADTDCERLTEYGTETVPLPADGKERHLR